MGSVARLFPLSAPLRVTRPPREARCGCESAPVGRRTPYDWSRMHPDPSGRVVLTDLRAAVTGGLRVLPAPDCFPVVISVSRDQTVVTAFPTLPPRETRCGTESRTVGRRTPHDWSTVHPEPSHRVVSTALGPPPADHPRLRVLPAADCFPVVISARRDQMGVPSSSSELHFHGNYGKMAWRKTPTPGQILGKTTGLVTAVVSPKLPK